jgi:1-acyl-sn-glycerol-3-phosphate acyltransferase
VSIAALVLSFVLLPVLFVVSAVPTLIVDLARRDRELPRFRRVLLLTLLVIVEIIGLTAVAVTWLVSPLGFRIQAERTQRWYQWIMHRWTQGLIWAISRAVPLTIDSSQLEQVDMSGNAIVIGRHRSLLDAVLPALLFGDHGLRVLYTLKEDLRWEPNIDLVGHFMNHRFVTRAPEDLDAELQPIRELASRVDDKSVAVIFPEGTFFTETRKERIVKSLQKRNPKHAEAAEKLNHLLAPRTAGTLALLEGAPDADVIIFGHAGFEPFGTIGRIFSNLGPKRYITIAAWRHPRASLPTAPDDLVDWLFERWAELDSWIANQHPLGSSG